MIVSTLLLIISSPFMHAGWNLISTRRDPSLVFFFVTTVSTALFVSTRLFVYQDTLP